MGRAVTRTGNDVRTCECQHNGMWHPDGGACRIGGCGCQKFVWGTIRFRRPHAELPVARGLRAHRRREVLSDA